MMPDDPTGLHTIPTRRRALADAPPPAPSPMVVLLPLADLIIGAATLSLLFATLGYVVGAGEADSVAERAEAVAIDAEATLAQARALCGGGR